MCALTADTNGTHTYDGQRYTVGQTVHSSRWIFVEGEILSYGDYYSFSPVVSRGPLRNAFRTFLVYCDSQAHFTSYLLVYASDSMINPRTRITSLYNGLQLEAPLVWRNPVVDKWGGLITRYPSWLAIGSPAWRSQTSNVQSWHGWRLYLHLVPVSLDFHVVFTPDPDEPSTPFDGFVSCIPRNGSATTAAGVLPRSAAPRPGHARRQRAVHVDATRPRQRGDHRAHHLPSAVLGQRLHRAAGRLCVVRADGGVPHRRAVLGEHQRLRISIGHMGLRDIAKRLTATVEEIDDERLQGRFAELDTVCISGG